MSKQLKLKIISIDPNLAHLSHNFFLPYFIVKQQQQQKSDKQKFCLLYETQN